MPKVVYAWDYVQWGGAQIYFLALMKEVKKHFDVMVILPRSSDKQLLKFIQDQGVQYEFVDTEADVKPAPTLARKLTRHLTKLRSENRLLKKINEHDLTNAIVHVELSPWQSLIPLARLARRTRVFITAHNSLGPAPLWRRLLWRIKLQAIARFASFWFFPSNQDSHNYFAQYFPARFVRDRMRVTYTSVNPREIDEALARPLDRGALLRRYGIASDALIVMCVGQFIDRKGRWTFLDAAARLKEESGLTFVWISTSAPSDPDLKRARSYGLGDRFRLITADEIGGDRTDLLEMFRLADIFVLASFVEGLPISLLEAMALGIPSISTNVNAIPEAVKDLETGILIEAGDDEKLAASISLLKADAGLRQRLGKDGRTWVLKNFDEREVAKIAMAAYREALGIE